MTTETSVIRRIHILRQMNVAELRCEWERLYGEPTRSRNKHYLYRRLAWRCQELQHGGLSDRTKRRLAELAPDAFVRARTPAEASEATAIAKPEPPRPKRDPRLPVVGSVITKRYRGRELRVVVREDGYEYDGAMFTSLTALAKSITGCRSINGKLFWGLTTRKRK